MEAFILQTVKCHEEKRSTRGINDSVTKGVKNYPEQF